MGLEALAIPMGASILIFGAVALVVHAIGVLVTHASELKKYTAKQMLVSLLTVFTNALAAGGRVITRTVTALVQWWVFFLVVFLLFSFINVSFNEYPSIWTGSVRVYNRFIGPWVHQTILIPIKVVDVLLRGLLPLYDSLIWFLKAVGIQGLLPLVVDEIETVLKMATTLVDLVKNLSSALFWFVESFFCEGVKCLHPERGVLDLLSSMGNLREFAALGTHLGRNLCSTLAAPMDILLYPLLDLNLAEFVHNLLNSVVQLLVVIPKATVVRCGLKPGNHFDLLMCTPDLAPFFNFLAASMSSLGLAVDNWINMAFLIVQELLTGESPSCDSAAAGVFPELLINQTLFKSAAAVVGLTDWMYSVTDGQTAYYLAHNDGTRMKMQVWPYAVDAALGVAAVTYSRVHDLDVSAFSSGKTSGSMQTTAMLGCNCSDTATGMAITCAILPMSGIPLDKAREDYLLQVLFPTTTAASMYTCAGVDLYVKSIRWSFTRYETTDASLGSSGDKTTLPTHDCIARGTCRELDAAVWLVPRCGQDVNRNAETACLDVAPCMPFCMAARTAGGGRDNLVLASARRWREGTTILGQDCALESGSAATVQPGAPVNSKVISRTATGVGGLLQVGGVGVYGFASDPVCRRASRVTSVVSKEESERMRVAANVRLFSQPFAITGDTTFSTVNLGGDAYAVQVERLEGSEVDVFSLNSINQQLPALPKAVVPLTTQDQEATDRVTIPYNYGTTRIAAVNSRNYVFYASNPNADALGAYFQYCSDISNPDKISKFGILLKSSYSRIRIYRVSAYRRCAPYSCGADLVSFAELQGFSGNFVRACDEVFNASVQSMEYLNEDNIAVTVQAAHVRSYDERRGTFQSGGNTTSRTYWLNPATMRIKPTVWETAVPSSSTAVLCPSMQRLPRVGSFMAEILNSGVFLLKFTVNSIVHTPGLVSMWRNGQVCPVPGGSMYHSVLANCGEQAFSLEDFFDSVDDAGAIFWHSLSLIGTLISPASPAIAEPLTRVMQGMSEYGQGTIDLWAARASVLTLTQVPIRDQVTQLWGAVQSGLEGRGPGILQGLSAGGAGIIAWSRYSYRAVSVIAVDITKKVLDPAVDLDAAKVFRLIWANLYDLQDEFDATVTNRMRMGCSGLKLMFGDTNPWADFVLHHCEGGSELTRGIMRLTLNIFVQIPMAKCVCKDSVGQPLSAFVSEHCAPSTPVSLLPTLFMVVNEVMAGNSGQYHSLACANVLESVKRDIRTSMDPWFDDQYRAMDALGSSIDYMTSSFDDKAGRCMDFQNDPHVSVIVPQPVDYFQRCAGTSRCKQTCSREWEAFRDSMWATSARSVPLAPIPVAMESLFFPGELDESLMLTNAVASVELPNALGKCLPRSRGLEDFSLAVAEAAGSSLTVTLWCAPLMAHSPVYRVESGGFAGTVPGTVLAVQFGDDTGEWLAVLTQVDGGQAVHVVRSTGVDAMPPLAEVLDENHVLMRVENMWLVEGAILVDLVTRHMVSSENRDTGRQSARSTAEAFHVFIRPSVAENATWNKAWSPTSASLMQFGGGQYWYTKLKPKQEGQGAQEYLFLPKEAGMLPYRVWIDSMQSLLQVGPVEAITRPARLSVLAGTVLASRSQGSSHVFATSTVGWDWLKQVRMAYGGEYVEGVFGSANVEVSVQVQGNCNDRSCEGCPTVQTQRLCLAYNKCALVNCVGTPVHQRRPLCGIGAVLRFSGNMGLQGVQAAWAVLSEMLGLTMQLSLMTMHEARLLWPEDAFLCSVCQAKDMTAVFFSILTSTVNSVLQLSDADVGFMYGGASNVDTNADAVLTISSNALNNFLHQIALGPLYMLVVMHQIVMCQVTGVIALLDGTGFTLSLKPANESSASDILAGQCLTVGAQTLANYPQDSPSSLGITVTSLAANAIQRLFLMQIGPFLHALDGALAYILGVVQSLGVLIMAQNTARCNPPDFSLKDVVNCACGDHRLRIPPARSSEGVQASALWCTGVLGMIDSGNQPYYVYNKFTYAELQAMSSGLKNYTQCVSSGVGGYKCPVPNDPWFQAQGVSTFNVLVKCRENFLKKRWDPASYILFKPQYWDLLRLQNGVVPELPKSGTDPWGGHQCLQDGDETTGSLHVQCLERFLLNRDWDATEYWMYERTGALLPDPEYTDACLVFSGPAEVQGLEQFAACVDGMGVGTNCTFPQHLWTPLSQNNIPTAEQHRVASHGVNRDGLVQHLYRRAQALVLQAVNRSLDVWGEGKSGAEAVDVEFFSVEGDVLHQTMDCIFMGPYSRVDYWPIPVCREGEECLRGPFWSRDEGDGDNRFVDVKGCTAPNTLPYTCGSPARQSLMRYLVRRVLSSGAGGRNQNITTIQRILRETLQGIRADWSSTGRFGCDCGGAGAGPFLPTCCGNTSSPLLPPSLNKTFTSINSTTVLRALQTGMHELYELALENQNVWLDFMDEVRPDEWEKYNWSSSQRVEDEARFDPMLATRSYTSGEEANSPLKNTDATLWDICHAALKQVFFTLPAGDTTILDDDDENLGDFDGDPDRLQAYVKRFTRQAFLKSPLFRHYAPRHAPSMSQMCEADHSSAPEEGGEPEGRVSFADFVQAGVVLMGGNELPGTTPVFHPQRFRVGVSVSSCLCGWQRVLDKCIVPVRDGTRDSVCSSGLVQCLDNEERSYNISQQPGLVPGFMSDWYCPEFELSPHWGFTDHVTAEQWLGHNQINLLMSSRDILHHGRAGVRAANIQSLSNKTKAKVNPSTRVVPLKHARLTTCTPGRPPPPNDLIAPFVDDLFPAAQAVEESGAVAYCLRYAIELARLEVLELLSMQEEWAAQRETAEEWRRRCGAQLHLLHICSTLNVYRPLVLSRDGIPLSCTHFRVVQPPTERRVIYITKQCLVSVDGVFYDPCRCVPCGGDLNTVLNLTEVVAKGEQCRLRFDPREIVEQGHPVGWTDGVDPLENDPARRLLDTASFMRKVWADSDAVGNVRNADHSWWAAEGLMTGNSEFCDGVLDWWPEHWSFPVGYHVTMPCEADDTAYRSFSQAFALDGNTLVYQHDLLRDVDLVDTHFGVGGVCRSGNLGMPMPETNNVRYCTRTPRDDTEDFTLPVSYGTDPTDDPDVWNQWKCSDSSKDLPWPNLDSTEALYQSAMVSIGTIPNMPQQNAMTYPANEMSMFNVGPWQEVGPEGNEWWLKQEQLCQDYTLRTCVVDSECPDMFACRGRVCQNNKDMNCTAHSDCQGLGMCMGVCMDRTLVQCIMHQECPPEQMCSGIGTCEDAVLAVQNRLVERGADVSLGLAVAGEDCGDTTVSRAFSVTGGSYWGNTDQDLLRAHGMCSFEDWFKYTQSYSQRGCSVLQSDGTLLANPSECVVVDLEQIATNQTKWWPAGKNRPELLYLRPTKCDRDYERLQGFTQCSPVTGAGATILREDEQMENTLRFDRFVRLHEDRSRVRLAVMPERSSLHTGFLGMGAGVVNSIEDLRENKDPGPFVPCASVGQCYPSDFFVNGVNRKTNRSFYDEAGARWRPYPTKTPFVCGVFGLESTSGQGCRLDVDVLPLYRFLCLEPIPDCLRLNRVEIQGKCSSITPEYQPSMQDRERVLKSLRDLFHVFPPFTAVSVYLDLTTCASELYAKIQARASWARSTAGMVLSTGLYFPLMFVLYEFPFDWFFQCVMLDSVRIDQSTRSPQDCRAFVTRASHTIDDYQPLFPTTGDPTEIYLKFLQGGYTRRVVEEYVAASGRDSMRAVEQALNEATQQFFPRTRTDESYPRCSTNLLWKIGPHGDPLPEEGHVEVRRAIIWNWNDPQSCKTNWHERLVESAKPYGIDRVTWDLQLTYPDPDNLVVQRGVGGASILRQVKSFMEAQMGISFLSFIQNSEDMRGCIRFDNRLPARYDFSRAPVPEALIPVQAVGEPGTVEMDETVDRTCAFLPAFDPAFKDLLTQQGCGAKREIKTSTRTDRLRVCQDILCTSVPVAYKRNGRFGCGYRMEGNAPQCTQDNPGCHVPLMEHVYNQVLQLYLRKEIPQPSLLRPTLFEWFQRESYWTFNGFQLDAALDYERNIQPNPERTVMCEITTDSANAIKFTTCNNPHYATLKQHVERHYKREGNVVVPAGQQLEWPIGRKALAKGVILSYSNMNKSINSRFMDGLFDDDKVCKNDNRLQVCRKENGTGVKFRSVNPWMLGRFNPYEVCDVQFTDQGEGGREYIYSYCIKEGNEGACIPFRERQIPAKCTADHTRFVSRPGVPRALQGNAFDYNLCFHRLEDDFESDTCMHDQALLGGFDGLPVGAPMDSSRNMLYGSPYANTETYRVARNLYEDSVWSIPADFREGFYEDGNPLWQGAEAPYGHLQIRETDIGGHRIGVAISRPDNDTTGVRFSQMDVVQISLGVNEDKRYIDSYTNPKKGRPTSEWVSTIREDMQAEDDDVKQLYDITYAPDSLSSSCPLKRWMFYSGNKPSFSPVIPSAQRARHLFHRIHHGLLAHPTMGRVEQGLFLGNYTTSNGFCACPVVPDIQQVQCLVSISSLPSTACSLAQTIQALKATEDSRFNAHVHVPIDSDRKQRRCQTSLDWPGVDGVLRDGSPLSATWEKASSTSNRLCHVLDRFRPFQYRYTASSELKEGVQNGNTITHGVCQTSRVISLDRTVLPRGYARCLRREMRDDYARFTCNVSSPVTSGEQGPQMPRRTRLTAQQLLQRRLERRTHCSKCSPPPRFTSQAGASIPAESSFGRLYRWSSERLLAKDLKDALCGGEEGQCRVLLNRSAWSKGQFMHNYLFSPRHLFANLSSEPPPSQKPARPAREDPARWTDRPWVYCPTPESLLTGEGCQGVISRAEWMRSKTRICPQMVRSYSTTVTNTSDGDPMARTPFCSIDNTTDAVCLAIAEARQLVIQANCIARGNLSCMPSPFVYHPASYEPSNNAWTRDSVTAFYRHLDQAACPAPSAAEQQSLIGFARQYQRGCPANAVNLVVSILQIVRVVATEVALLISSMLGILIKGAGLLLPAKAADMRKYIASDWQYIRTKWRSVLDTAGDLLVDAMLNSGELGARIMGFLERACDRINAGISWFLNVWCNYIQQYMIQVLAGLRYAMGIMGAGFDMLQDFVDEIFQGILPAAFVQKYAQQNFKDALVEAYSRPTEHKDKVKAQSNVPDTVNPRPTSQTTKKKKNMLSTVTGMVGRIGKSPAGKALGFLGAGLAAYEFVSGVMDVIEEEKLRQLWPENFTLFDLSGVVNSLDDMERFLLQDDSCYEYHLAQRQNLSYVRFQCLRLNLDSYNATSAGTTSLVSTQCWADARPLLAQNSLFACSAASTCCRTSECREFIMCASCAEPELPGINKYGCDSLRKTCVCGQAKNTYDRCSSNRQCDINSQCELVSALNSISYGTIPCANCPASAQVMCLLPSSGFPARCSCMLDSVKGYDLCSDRSGTRTTVTGSRLCAYLHGSPPGSTWVFDMEDLIMVPCQKVRVGVCSTVMQGGRVIQMVVAETVSQVSSARVGRRLMSDDEDPERVVAEPGAPTYDAYESEYELADSEALHSLLTAPGWNTTAAPCSTLALAYQANSTLGILETHTLHKCGFWRYVGKRVIQRYNLSLPLAGHETFLLSMDDMVYALMTPDVAVALLRNPGALGAAIMYHPWLKPVRAFGVLVANQLEHLRWIRDIDADVHDVLFGDGPEPVEPNEAEREAWGNLHDRPTPRFQGASEQGARAIPSPPVAPLPSADGATRKLLSLQDSAQAVVRYSVAVIQQASTDGHTPSVAAGAWASADFSWPPRYDFSMSECPLAQSILHIGYQAAIVNKLYFENFHKPRPVKDKSLRANLPHWPWLRNISTLPQTVAASGRSWASAALHWTLDLLAIPPSHIVTFFTDDREWSLQWVLQTTIQCDLAAVVTCSRHDKDILMSTVVFAMLYLVVSLLASSVGMGFLATVLLLSYPWFILWYVFGMAPSCFPMLPPCLMSDLVSTLEVLVPTAILFPPALLCDPAGQAGRPLNQTCLRSCSELGFGSWEDPLAFAICDTDPKTCSYFIALGPSGLVFLDTWLWDPLRTAMARAYQRVLYEDPTPHRVCTWVSFIWVVPLLALVVGVLVVAGAVLAFVFDLLPSLVTFLCQLYVFYES